jgi:hypothetical protein
MDVDGPTDQIQLDDYKRIFPVFWEHPAVIGITLWGYRPGLWRDAEGAALVRADGSERPALAWLRTYLATNQVPVVTAGQSFRVSETANTGTYVGTVQASDPDGGTLAEWQIVGGSGSAVFTINAASGQITVGNATLLGSGGQTTHTLQVRVSDGRDRSAPQELTIQVVSATAVSSRLVNIATRAFSGPGNRVTIGGFVIAGPTAKRVLIRAVGPSLTSLGLAASEVLLDPFVEVHRGEPVIASNDNWSAADNASEIASVAAQIGARPLDNTDTRSSALLIVLDPGVYTFVANGKNGTSGIVLLEVYDADGPAAAATFANIATRAYSSTGNAVTIGGFVVNGPDSQPVLLRAVGPSLSEHGISPAEILSDPMIELHRGEPVIASNDDWAADGQSAAILAAAARIGASPLALTDTKSSAMLLNLPAGAYTFIVRGKSNASGIVLVEVYDAR